MPVQPIDYQAVITDLEMKRGQINARIDSAIAAIRQVMALEGTSHALPLGLPLEAKGDIKQGPYAAMLMQPAAFKHLASVGRAVPNVVLARALEDGGYRHGSKNFPNTLNSVLWRRHKTVGDIRKTAKGWELVGAQ